MLAKKMYRDIKNNISQFISIFILIFLGVLIYVGLNSIAYGMKKSSDLFYKDTSLADAYMIGSIYTEQDIVELEDIEGINNVEGRYQTRVSLKDNSNILLELNYINFNSISSVWVIEGEPFDPDKSGIWLDAMFADEHNLELGDEISYINDYAEISETIVGLIMHPEYVFSIKNEQEALPNHFTYGYGFCSANKSGHNDYNQVLIDTDLDKVELKSNISKIFKDSNVILAMQNEQVSYNMFDSEITKINAIQMIFPVIFLLVAILTILTTMTRIVINQRMQIGILKALGFNNIKIYVHYASYGVLISILGGFLGVIAGVNILPAKFFAFQSNYYTLPKWYCQFDVITILVVIVCMLLCGLCGIIACRKELNDVVCNILRPKILTNSKHNILERFKWWKKCKFDTQWNIRDIMRCKLRSFITIFGVLGSISLLLCAIGMKDTINNAIDIYYNEMNLFQTNVDLPDIIDEKTYVDLEKDDDIQLYYSRTVEIETSDIIKSVEIMIYDEGDYVKFVNKENKIINFIGDGIYVTRKTAEVLNVKKNDIITLLFYGSDDYVECMILDIIYTPLGQGVYASKNFADDNQISLYPSGFLTDLDGADLDAYDTESIQTKDKMIDIFDQLMNMMNVIIIIMIVAAIALGIVVLYNLGVLSYYERTRELATLKVLGFQYKRLFRIILIQNIWLTVVGIIIGCPAGYIILKNMLNFMGEHYDMTVYISMYSFIICILGFMLLSILVSAILGKKLKKVDMVSALKSIE